MTKIRGVVVIVDCDQCKGEGWVPDWRERSRQSPNGIGAGTIKRCYFCNGHKTMKKEITLEEFKEALP